MKQVWFISLFLLTTSCDILAQTKDLDYFIDQGLQNSPLLKDYQFQLKSNALDSQRVKAGYGPQLNGTSTGLYAPIVKGWGYDAAITNLHSYNALIGVSQIIIGKQNTNSQYLSIQLQNLELQNRGKITEQDLKRSITQQYITSYGDLLQINFNQEMLSLLNDEAAILKTLAGNGIYKQTDYLSFLVSIQQQEILIKQIRNQYQNNLATLNYISGLTDTAFTVLSPPVISINALPEPEQTVFYQQFQIDSMKITANDKQIDFSYKPRISWFADGGYNSSFISPAYKNFGMSAGIALTVPIYDGNQRKMLHAKNFIAEETRKHYEDFFYQQYHQQIAQLQQQLQLTGALITQATIQIKYTEGLIKAQQRQLATGDVRITDYIIAIGNYLNAKNIISQNTISQLQIINQINYWNRKT